MGDVVKIENGDLTALINPQGAWITQFDAGGLPILFPKQSFTMPDGSEKARGGCHVCLPNFGPGGDSGLPQHGFGRDMRWNIAEKSDRNITLGLTSLPEIYAGMDAKLRYELGTSNLSMNLTVTNNGAGRLRVSPGFHPYFVCKESVVSVDGRLQEVEKLQEATVLERPAKNLQIGAATYKIQADGLDEWILWSDRLSQYVCLEPTARGFSFLGAPQQEDWLGPGQSKKWSYAIHLLGSGFILR